MLDRALEAQFDNDDLNLNQNLIRSPDLNFMHQLKVEDRSGENPSINDQPSAVTTQD
jgi:hypothetical protein